MALALGVWDGPSILPTALSCWRRRPAIYELKGDACWLTTTASLGPIMADYMVGKGLVA